MSIFIPNILKNVKIAKDEKGAESKWRDAIKKYGIDSIPNLDPYKSIRCEGEVYQELLKLFKATMAVAGVSPAEIGDMENAPNIQISLCAVQRAIAFGMYGAAYEILRDARIGHLDAERASFFLYFCSLGTDYSIRALIFRRYAAATLACSDFPKEYPDFFWQYLSGDNDLDKFSIRWNPSGYLQYLILMHSWASALSCRADDIELFLCSIAQKYSDKDGRINKGKLQNGVDLLNI